jgi:hypothetical protein
LGNVKVHQTKTKTGHRYSPAVADANQRLLEKHVMPAFKDYWLEDIHASDLEEFRDSLMEYLANPSDSFSSGT